MTQLHYVSQAFQAKCWTCKCKYMVMRLVMTMCPCVQGYEAINSLPHDMPLLYQTDTHARETAEREVGRMTKVIRWIQLQQWR